MHAPKVNPNQAAIDAFFAAGGEPCKIKGRSTPPKHLSLRSGNHIKPRKYVADAVRESLKARVRAS